MLWPLKTLVVIMMPSASFPLLLGSSSTHMVRVT
jgi:hypothetical protein